MPRDGSLTPRDLADKGLHVLRVECEKCGRSGRYRVIKLAEQIGSDGKLMDWLYNLTREPTYARIGASAMTLAQSRAVTKNSPAA